MAVFACATTQLTHPRARPARVSLAWGGGGPPPQPPILLHTIPCTPLPQIVPDSAPPPGTADGGARAQPKAAAGGGSNPLQVAHSWADLPQPLVEAILAALWKSDAGGPTAAAAVRGAVT